MRNQVVYTDGTDVRFRERRETVSSHICRYSDKSFKTSRGVNKIKLAFSATTNHRQTPDIKNQAEQGFRYAWQWLRHLTSALVIIVLVLATGFDLAQVSQLLENIKKENRQSKDANERRPAT